MEACRAAKGKALWLCIWKGSACTTRGAIEQSRQERDQSVSPAINLLPAPSCAILLRVL
jgi:hypothetical protein